MKTHFPTRDALAVEFSSKKRRTLRLRRFASIVLLTLGGLGALCLLIVLVSVYARLRSQRDMAIAASQSTSQLLLQRERELADLTASNAQLLSDLDELKSKLVSKLEYVEVLEKQIQQLRAQKDEADSRQLKNLKERLSAVTNEREETLKLLNSLKSKNREILQQYFDRTLAMCDSLRSDPGLVAKELQELRAMAGENDFDTALLEQRLTRLPLPRTIPPQAAITVHSACREGQTTIVDFLVKGSDASRIDGITRRELELRDGSRRVHAIEVTEKTEKPLQHYVAVLLDFSGSMTGAPRDAMVAGARELLGTLATTAQIRAWAFANDARAVSPWSLDSKIHEAAIREIPTDGGTALYKCLRLAADDLKGQSGKRSIVLFTDGGDSFQRESLEEVIAKCREAEIAVHVVGLRTGETRSDILQRISAATDGTIQETNAVDQIAATFSRVAETLAQRLYRIRISEPLDSTVLNLTVGSSAVAEISIPIQKPVR